jgi:hypothetical protein
MRWDEAVALVPEPTAVRMRCDTGCDVAEPNHSVLWCWTMCPVIRTISLTYE